MLQQIDLEKLGRQRPAVFASALSEYLFCFSLLMTSMMAVSSPQYHPTNYSPRAPSLVSNVRLELYP